MRNERAVASARGGGNVGGRHPASRSPDASGAADLMSLSVRSGEGLSQRAEVPQGGNFWRGR